MDEKKHTWGELYNTLQEMQHELEDESFLKCLALVAALEKSQTLFEIRNTIDTFPLSEYELNRFNSLCLDGIVNTIYELDPLLTLILTTKNLQTFKYYCYRGFLQECHVVQLCKLGHTEMLEFAIEEKFIGFYGTSPLRGLATSLNVNMDTSSINMDTYRISNVLIDHNEIPYSNCTIGYLTAAYGNMDTMRMILKKFPCYIYEYIRASLAAKNTAMTKLIIDTAYEHKNEICCKDDEILEWCFMRLCEYGELDLIKYMVKRGEFDIHFDNDSYVFEARYFGKSEVLNYLLELGLQDGYRTLAHGYTHYFSKID